MQNITLYVGKDSSAITKRLTEIYNKSTKKCITNLSDHTQDIKIDNNRIKELADNEDALYYHLVKCSREEAQKLYKNTNLEYLKNLLNMICAEGDILILDQFDKDLYMQAIIDVAIAIGQVGKLWRSVYVSGSSLLTELVFVSTDENNIGHYEHNTHLIDGDKDIPLTPEQSVKFFDVELR